MSFELAQFEASPNSVLPEPATIAMLGIGMIGLTLLRSTRRSPR